MEFSWSDVISAAIPTIGSFVSGYTKPAEPIAYGNTKEAFDAKMALEQQQLAQQLEIARMNAASGGAGAGAALRAAQLQYDAAIKQLREKTLADALAAELQSQGQAASAVQTAADLAARTRQQMGETGRVGYQNAAQGIAAFKA